jgi:hypothetical protein
MFEKKSWDLASQGFEQPPINEEKPTFLKRKEASMKRK